MKRRMRVTKGRKIGGLKASAEDSGLGGGGSGEIGRMYKPRKKRVTLRLDADVLAWFKKQGHGYQTRINRALRAVMTEKRKRSEE